MICTRCGGTGLLNEHLVPESMWAQHERGELPLEDILQLLRDEQPDVTACDCCGDGEEQWHGEPGAHYEGGDDPGPRGPYARNGGLPRCA